VGAKPARAASGCTHLWNGLTARVRVRVLSHVASGAGPMAEGIMCGVREYEGIVRVS